MSQQTQEAYLAKLKGKDLTREIERLRGAKSFTSHSQLGMIANPKRSSGGESDGSGPKKKIIIYAVIGIGALLYIMYGI